MDTAKMRVCAQLLPEPGDKVVCECVDEIERLRKNCMSAEARIAELREALSYVVNVAARTPIDLRSAQLVLGRPDDLSALNEALAKMLEEVAAEYERGQEAHSISAWIGRDIRRRAQEIRERCAEQLEKGETTA